jgi:hypothetical protein
MPRPYHSSRYHHPHIIGWAVQIIQQVKELMASYVCATPRRKRFKLNVQWIRWVRTRAIALRSRRLTAYVIIWQ